MMAAKTICENLNKLRKRIREADLHGNDFQTGNFLVNPCLSLKSVAGKTFSVCRDKFGDHKLELFDYGPFRTRNNFKAIWFDQRTFRLIHVDLFSTLSALMSDI